MRGRLLLLAVLVAVLAAAGPTWAEQQQQQQRGQPHPDAPRLVPLAALDGYQEGAELRLFCSASAPNHAGPLQFEWRRDDRPLGPETAAVSMMDDSSSMLRLHQLRADHSGNYTCLARNQLGSDSSTVRVNVYVRLKWLREPPAELRLRLGKPLLLDCDASGQPPPLISWTALRDQRTVRSKVLRIDRLQANDSGLYECRASSASPQTGSPTEPRELRKLVRLVVNVFQTVIDPPAGGGPAGWHPVAITIIATTATATATIKTSASARTGREDIFTTTNFKSPP